MHLILAFLFDSWHFDAGSVDVKFRGNQSERYEGKSHVDEFRDVHLIKLLANVGSICNVDLGQQCST